MDKTLTEQEIALLRRKLDLLLRTGQLLVESAADTNRVVRNLNRDEELCPPGGLVVLCDSIPEYFHLCPLKKRLQR